MKWNANAHTRWKVYANIGTANILKKKTNKTIGTVMKMDEKEITKHIYDSVNDDWDIIEVDVLDDDYIEYELEKRDGIDFDCEMISHMKNLFKKDKFFDKYGLGLGNMPNCRFLVQVYDMTGI